MTSFPEQDHASFLLWNHRWTNLLSLPSCSHLVPGPGARERPRCRTGAGRMCPECGLDHQLPGAHVPWCCTAVDGWEGKISGTWLSEISFTGQGKGWKNCRIHWVYSGLHFGRTFGSLLHSSRISVAGRRPLCIGLTLHKDGKQAREVGMHRNIPSGLCLFRFLSLQLALKVLTYF